ncbi:MAG TPA: AbrB/MazE/SpoVT family DNA-binding domain-containing protein, partial [Kiritimatiellia bacterium]|nr:AbrB/MazE/SpoVT family DNA-binding domain-containing protein [Kiritimatiellia bacterium]
PRVRHDNRNNVTILTHTHLEPLLVAALTRQVNVDTVITCLKWEVLMQTVEVKIARIGNSRGVRIPADVLRRYAFKDTAIMVENVDGVLLRPKRQVDEKMSWADTAKAMAADAEDWSDWDALNADGLDAIPWEPAEVAEKRSGYGKVRQTASRKRP